MEVTDSRVKEAAIEMANECFAMRARLLNRELTSIYNDHFRELGVTAAQITLLAAISIQAAPTPVELSRSLNIEKSTLSRNLERIEKSGWIRIERGNTGQQHCMFLTESGEELFMNAHPEWVKAQAAARSLIGQQEATSLISIGDKLTH